jgi:hypothetical protein
VLSLRSTAKRKRRFCARGKYPVNPSPQAVKEHCSWLVAGHDYVPADGPRAAELLRGRRTALCSSKSAGRPRRGGGDCGGVDRHHRRLRICRLSTEARRHSESPWQEPRPATAPPWLAGSASRSCNDDGSPMAVRVAVRSAPSPTEEPAAASPNPAMRNRSPGNGTRSRITTGPGSESGNASFSNARSTAASDLA